MDFCNCRSFSRFCIGTSLFLIYINDLVDNLSSEAKLFTDDTSLFSVVYDEKLTVENLIKILKPYLNGLINGKCNLIQIKISKHFKLFFLIRVPSSSYSPLYFNQAEYQL